jgi:hypothetical protein
MKEKFKTAMNRLLFAIAFFSSLGMNLYILFGHEFYSKEPNVIDWSWFFDTNSHPWGIFAANIVFSCSNLLFWVIGVDHIGRHLWEDWGKHEHLGV